MFVNSKVNGFLLLLTFGLLCGVIAGILFGLGMGLYLETPARAIANPSTFVVFSVIGAIFGLIPGVLYGLSSYYFTSQSDWMLTGGIYGAVPGFVLFFGLGLQWHLLLICVSYGALIGFLNRTFPNWWGMRLRAEGIKLLRQKS